MASETFAEFVERFLTSVTIPGSMPRGIEVLQPYRDPEVRRVVHEMCTRFYASGSTRIGVWGINPGRFGAGLTGLAFTDPWAVEHDLGITTSLSGRREMSAEFISMVISAYGGPESFYRDVYMSALSPLGFIREGVNINFYDDAALEKMMTPHIIGWMNDVFAHCVRRDVTILLGSGKLRTFMERSVREAVGVSEVIYLDHPRYIMQYRRRDMERYVQLYVDTIQQAAASVG
ncbi:MAG: uracil-DNA glycosylase family protein [Candidatus Kapaibacterium sp.]